MRPKKREFALQKSAQDETVNIDSCIDKNAFSVNL